MNVVIGMMKDYERDSLLSSEKEVNDLTHEEAEVCCSFSGDCDENPWPFKGQTHERSV